MHTAHALHMHCTWTLHITTHAHCTCTLHMHCTCTHVHALHMDTAHALHMHTAHAHCTCTAHAVHMHTQAIPHTGGLRVAARPQQVDQEAPDGPLPAGLRQRRGRRRIPGVLRRHGGAARVHQLGRERGVGRPVGRVRVHRCLRRAGSVPLHERRSGSSDAGGRRRAAGARGAAAHAHGARMGLPQAGGLAEYGADHRWARVYGALPQESRRVPGAPRMQCM